MDPIPTDTHAAEISATIDELELGLAQIPLSKAINRIDDWKREIEATERADLGPIADELGQLHSALTGVGLDGVAIGGILARLGEKTEGVADSAPEALQDKLRRLGSILRHAGSALRANAS